MSLGAVVGLGPAHRRHAQRDDRLGVRGRGRRAARHGGRRIRLGPVTTRAAFTRLFRGLMACETDPHINRFRFLDSQIVPLRVSGGGLLYICGTFHVREIRLERGKFPLGLEEDIGAEQGRHDARP